MIFLDDMLLIAESRQDLEHQSREVLTLLMLLGFKIKWEKSQLLPIHVSGPHNRHNPHDSDLTRSKGAEDPEGMPINPQQGQSVSEGLAAANWNDVGSNTGGLASPTTLQNAPGIEDKNTEENRVFPDYGVTNKESKAKLEWWIAMLNRWNGCPILPLTSDLVIETDA